jgi:hypothetical protein
MIKSPEYSLPQLPSPLGKGWGWGYFKSSLRGDLEGLFCYKDITDRKTRRTKWHRGYSVCLHSEMKLKRSGEKP